MRILFQFIYGSVITAKAAFCGTIQGMWREKDAYS
jgi:hypothetical protein